MAKPKKVVVNGKTFYDIQIKIQGVRASKRCGSIKEAEAFQATRKAEIKAGKTSAAPAGATVADLLDDYYKKVASKQDEANGDFWHRNKINALKRTELGTVPLRDLNAVHIETWRDERLEEGVTGETVRKDWTELLNAFTRAVKVTKWILACPMVGVDRPPAGKARTRLPSAMEITALERALGWTLEAAPVSLAQRTAEVMKFCQETAMRDSEMCELTWDRVNWAGLFVFLPMTKNGESREVPLTDAAIAVLRKMETVRAGDLVFQIRASQRYDQFRAATKRLGIIDLHFHDFRAWSLTRWAKKVEILTLARISGHKNINQLRTYYRESTTDIAKAMSAAAKTEAIPASTTMEQQL